MAPLPTINGIQRVAFMWRIGAGGLTAVNVMHFLTASTDTLALKNLLNTNVTALMWGGTTNTASVYQLAITPLDGTSATQLYAVSGANWTGNQGTGDYMPAAAAVISLRTSQRGRQNRGRVYLPFISEACVANGSFSVAITTWQGAWDTFRSAMATGSMPLHVASYGHSLHKTKGSGGVITYTPVTWTPHSNAVVTTTFEAVLGTMRPRQGRLR